MHRKIISAEDFPRAIFDSGHDGSRRLGSLDIQVIDDVTEKVTDEIVVPERWVKKGFLESHAIIWIGSRHIIDQIEQSRVAFVQLRALQIGRAIRNIVTLRFGPERHTSAGGDEVDNATE